VWINAAVPHEVRLLLDDPAGRCQELALSHLQEPLRNLLLPPEKAETDEEEFGAPRSHLMTYYEEHQHRHTQIGWAWGMFFTLLGDRRLAAPRIRIRDFVTATQAEWRQDWHSATGLPVALIDKVERSLLHAYAWADKLAIYYANAYRSTYLLC